jgi:hypothetical protein
MEENNWKYLRILKRAIKDQYNKVVVLLDKLKKLEIKITKMKEEIFVKISFSSLRSLFEEENKDTCLHL